MRLCVGSLESTDSSIQYQSMALVSPWPLQRPRYEPNLKVVKSIQQIWEHPFLRPSIQLFLPSFEFGEARTTREKVTAAFLLGNLDLGEAAGLAVVVSALNIPRVVLFGQLDPLVEEELYLDVLDSLEIPRENLSIFRGKHETPWMPGGLVFPNGGYNLHSEHPGIISAFLLNVVQLFHPHIQIGSQSRPPS